MDKIEAYYQFVPIQLYSTIRVTIETKHSMDSVFTANITKEITNVLSLIISKYMFLSSDDSIWYENFYKEDELIITAVDRSL